MKTQSGKRASLLESAGFIAIERGVEALTLDAVAKHAEVSKGGLLYHFPTKEALLIGMAEQIIHEFDALLDLEIEKEASLAKAAKQGQWLRAYVRLCTSIREEHEVMTDALAIVSLTDPKMRSVTRRAFERWEQRSLNDGVKADVATLVRVVADGCWLRALYGFEDEKKAQHDFALLRENLLSLIEKSIVPPQEGR